MPKIIRITTTPLSLKYLLFNQMRYMVDHGFDVIMVSSYGKEWTELLKNEKCRHYIIPMTREISPLQDLVSLWRLYRLFVKEKPDIVHSHTPKAGLLAMLAARLACVDIRIHTVAGLRFMTTTGFMRKLLILTEKLTGWAANYVWPNSFSLLNYIKKYRLVKESKLQVIGYGSSNGINLNRFSVESLLDEQLTHIKKMIEYDTRYRYILIVGRIVKDKGINEVMQCFKILYDEYPSLRLIVLGDFEDKVNPISDEARNILQTHPAIIHVGWNDQVEYFMHIAELLVHASYREGFPNTLLQAGAMLCPVICTEIEGNVDIVTHRETGLIFKPGDVDDLLQKLRYALLHKDEMKGYAIKLRKKVEEKFSQSYLHECIRLRYMEILQQKNKA